MNESVAACFSGWGVVLRTDLTRALGDSHEPSFSIAIIVDLPVIVFPENIIAGIMSCCLYFSSVFQ